MPSRFQSVDITANTIENVGQGGASGGTYIVQILNKNQDSAATINLGVSISNNSFDNARKILNNEGLSPNSQMTFSGLVLDSAEFVNIQSNIDSCNAILMGHDI